MSVLETAIADAMAGEVPSPADRLDGLDRSQPALGQPIKDVPPLGDGWIDVSSSTWKSSGVHLSFMNDESRRRVDGSPLAIRLHPRRQSLEG